VQQWGAKCCAELKQLLLHAQRLDLKNREDYLRAQLHSALESATSKVIDKCARSKSSASGTCWMISNVAPVGKKNVKVQYTFQQSSQNFGSWVANGLPKSAKGEAGVLYQSVW
jgi:hypothetical protein